MTYPPYPAIKMERNTALRHMDTLCILGSSMLEEYVKTRDQNLLVRIGMVTALAYDFRDISTDTRKQWKTLSEKIETIIYKNASPESLNQA